LGLNFNPDDDARDFRFDVPLRGLKDVRASVKAFFSGLER
jgi:hypothetical protein